MSNQEILKKETKIGGDDSISIESDQRVESMEYKISQETCAESREPKIIITIPAYNEENHIGKVIKKIKEVMEKTSYDYKILVVDDGSTDETKNVAARNGVYVVSNERNLGLAETFCREMDLCLRMNADIIVHTDADGQYPAEYIPLLIKKIENGYDLVIGSRFNGGEYSGPLGKKIGNILFAKIFSLFLGKKVSDTTSGFRAFKPEIANFPMVSDFTYTQEQLIRAGKAYFKIGEIPIQTNGTRSSRLFNNIFDYAIRAIKTFYRIYKVYIKNR